MPEKNSCKSTSLLVFVLCFRTGLSDIIIAPSSREAELGGSTYFNCSTSDASKEIQWFYYSVSSTDRSVVYANGQFNALYLGRFTMDANVTTDEYNLIITSVVKDDAGEYECQDEEGAGMKRSAQLIILGQDLICQSNVNVQKIIGPNSCGIEPDELILSCVVQYHGNESPILQWGLNDNNEAIIDGVANETIGNRVIYNLTMTTEQISSDAFYVCRTTRSTSTISCNSGEVKVVGSTATCYQNTTPCVSAIVVTWLLLIPIIIVASAFLGFFCQVRRPLKILNQPLNRLSRKVSRKSEECSPEAFSLTSEREEGPIDEHWMDTRELTRRVQQKDKEVLDLQSKNKQLQIEKSELEARLYPKALASYAKSKFLTEISIKDSKMESKQETKPIFGMTLIGGKLYVVTEESSEIAVYDSVIYAAEPSLSILELLNPQDIASCSKKNCLYVCDGSPGQEQFIIRFDLASKNVLYKWSVGEDDCHLSVGRNSNVIVSLFNGNKIVEYSPDGEEIMTVKLSPADNIIHPWHAIKTSSMHFIFSHGFGEDPLQRVCVSGADGKIMKSFGGKKGSDKEQMNRPVHLLEDSSRNILVADMKNKRVLLLSQTLELKKSLVSSDKLRFPMRLCLDEEREILFVADNNYKEKKGTYDSGRILIFNCKK